jgi:GntR family transcriptional regulator/MocR family aminotransferase
MDGGQVRRAKTEPNDRAKTDFSAPCDRVRLELDRQSRTPFYRQIYERLSDAITRGVLLPGQRLPSARSLADHLATSRGTIDLAYSLLSGEGFVHTQGAAGTVVAGGLANPLERLPNRPAASPLSRGESASGTSAIKPFTMGLPALDVFPRKLWIRLSTRCARRLTTAGAMAGQGAAGYPPLREAIVSYLAVSRGIPCSARQVIITCGFQSALGMIARAFLNPGDEVWLEDPCYFMVRTALKVAGAKVVGVPVDEEGLDVAAGIARMPHARLAYVTPSHQAPLGVSLSPARRLDLLSWATRAGAWIIEDDYDSEFRYGSRPLPALKSLDSSGRVLYVGSFSKVLFPGLRLGYLVAPESQVDRLNAVYDTLYRDGLTLNQAIVADFMMEGHFARHIKRMRKLYADRRAALASALVDVFGKTIDLQLQAGGMHLLARFPACRSDLDWVARAAAHGLQPAPFSQWRVDRECGQGLLLSFTNIPPQDAREVALRLKQAVADELRDAGSRAVRRSPSK